MGSCLKGRVSVLKDEFWRWLQNNVNALDTTELYT